MSTDVARKYGTTNPVLIAARINHDPHDEFAWCQGWRFALCDYLTFVCEERVPFFRSSAHSPEEDAHEYQELTEIQPSPDECWYALRILDRYRVWLGLAGRDY